MNAMIDRDKWLAAINEEPDGPCTATIPFFYVTLRKESNGIALPLLATLMVKSVDELERSLGGEGVIYDEGYSTEDPQRLKLRLVLRNSFGGIERIGKILDTIDALLDKARMEISSDSNADIRSKIASELASPIPSEVIRHLEHSVPQIAS